MTVDTETPLAEALEKEKHLLQRFIEILNKEHEQLLAGKTEDLPALAATKTELAAALEAAETERRSHAGKTAAAEKFHTPWQEIRELSAAAARANIENGVILATLMRHVEGALRIFTGADEPFYGPAGSQPRGTGSRSLASA